MIRTSSQRPAWGKALVFGFSLAALMVAASLMLPARPTHADTTFTVDLTGDFRDPDPGEWDVRDLEEFMKEAPVSKG